MSHALRVRHPATFLQIPDDTRLPAYMTALSTYRASCRYSLRLPNYSYRNPLLPHTSIVALKARATVNVSIHDT